MAEAADTEGFVWHTPAEAKAWNARLDWKHPDYVALLKERARRLERLRENPKLVQAAKIHYRNNPWDLIDDWGMTFDPRNADIGRPTTIPFLIFDKQLEFLQWVEWMWRNRHRGQCEKSRESGVTWLAVSWSVARWLTVPGFVAGFGSMKEENVDHKGNPKAIFWMARFFLRHLPPEFLPAEFDLRVHAPKMRIVNPENGAALIGEAGDNIGRGGRTSVYFVDEAAYVQHQEAVEAALSNTTNCQIDISTWAGPGNQFFTKNQRLQGDDRLFVFDWTDDPRKDQAWYDRKAEELGNPVIMASEVDRDPYASQTDSFIPAHYIRAAFDAHKTLGFRGTGIRVTAFDPADKGDAKATANRHGSVIQGLDELNQGDITQAIPWAFGIAETYRAEVLVFDGDGLGVPTMREHIMHDLPRGMRLEAFHGSGQVENPKDPYGASSYDSGVDKPSDLRSNADTFENYRAQAWTWLYERFQKTHEAIERASAGQVVNANPDDLISIDTEACGQRMALRLLAELSAPKRVWSKNGKIMVEQKERMRARGVKSPNLADAVVMAYSRRRPVPEADLMRWRAPKTPRYKDPRTGY